jgi:hypothetical protein
MRFLPLLLLAALCGGCATVQRPVPGPLASDETSALVADCAEILAGRFAPAKTTFAVTGFPATLPAALAEALRAKGYAVAEPGSVGTDCTVALDVVDDGSLLLRVSVGEWTACRLYQRDPSGFAALTPFSVSTGDPTNG